MQGSYLRGEILKEISAVASLKDENTRTVKEPW